MMAISRRFLVESNVSPNDSTVSFPCSDIIISAGIGLPPPREEWIFIWTMLA